MTTHPKYFKDANGMAQALAAWAKILALCSAKVSAGVRFLSANAADLLDYTENSLQRKALHKRMSAIASAFKALVKRQMDTQPNTTGRVLNPLWSETPDSETAAEIVTARVWGKVKSLLHTYLTATQREAVPLKIGDQDDSRMEIINLDLTPLNEIGIDDDANERADTVYHRFVPTPAVAVKASRKEAQETIDIDA